MLAEMKQAALVQRWGSAPLQLPNSYMLDSAHNPMQNLNSFTPPERHRFHFLDALRGLAAIMVVMRHAPIEYSGHFRSTNSFLAVDFFFCLSGFIVAFSYEKRLTTSLTGKDFFAARIIRLYPIAAAGTILGAIAVFFRLKLHETIPVPVPSLTLATIFGIAVIPYTAALFPLDGVMWTLFLELIANLVYASMMRLRVGGNVVLGLIAATSALFLVSGRLSFGTLDLGFNLNTLYVGFSRVGLSFSLGVLTFRLYQHYAHKVESSIWITRWTLCGFLLALGGPGLLSRNPYGEVFLLLIVFPLVVFFGAKASLPMRWTGLCATLGAISYPVYILHPPLLDPLYSATAYHFSVAHSTLASAAMLTYTGVLVLVAFLAAKYFETPVRRWLTGLHRAHFGK